MILTLTELRADKIAAQRKLEASLEKVWRTHETRIVVWRPASRQMPIIHNGRYWSTSLAPDPNDKTPLFWNPFGAYRQSGGLQIAVEINIATDSNQRRVSGFFARDAATDTIYLMHDGAVGGGQRGVGRAAFLEWSDARLVPVVNSQGDLRPGIVVAPIESRTTASDIARFIQNVLDFKQAVKDGYTSSAQRTYEDYYDEFAGKKRRRRIEEVEYISRHGDIVRALRDWRLKDSKPNERVVKNAYIDLGIETDGHLIELYEVKTNCDRQTLYSAIGQVLVHDEAQTKGMCRRFLVLPKDDEIPDDVSRALMLHPYFINSI